MMADPKRTQRMASMIWQYLADDIQMLMPEYMITISDVKVSKDLKHADIFLTVLENLLIQDLQ